MSELDIIARESEDFNEFKKEVLEQFKNKLKDSKETEKWLKEIYNKSNKSHT